MRRTEMVARVEGNVSLVLGERWLERGFLLFLRAKKAATIEEIEDSAKKQVCKIVREKYIDGCDVECKLEFESFSIVEGVESEEDLRMIPC